MTNHYNHKFSDLLKEKLRPGANRPDLTNSKTLSTEKPKESVIMFLLNYSKALEFRQLNNHQVAEYLIN